MPELPVLEGVVLGELVDPDEPPDPDDPPGEPFEAPDDPLDELSEVDAGVAAGVLLPEPDSDDDVDEAEVEELFEPPLESVL